MNQTRCMGYLVVVMFVITILLEIRIQMVTYLVAYYCLQPYLAEQNKLPSCSEAAFQHCQFCASTLVLRCATYHGWWWC